MPINQNTIESTEDDIYLAKMTMDEVGADIEQHGHVAVTDENRTQDPFTDKGALANALDEALDYSNPNYDPTNESQGDIEGITNDPQSPKKSDEVIKPDDITMDRAPEVQERTSKEVDPKDAKYSLAEALDSVVAMDSESDIAEESDEDAHRKWESNEIKKSVPKIPESMGGKDEPDSNGLIYLDYTFTVDPSKYRSPNYQPIADAGMVGNIKSSATEVQPEQEANDKVDEDMSVDETIVEAGGEPSKDAEKVAAKEANEDEKEVASIGKPIEEKKTEDEAPEKVVLDYATFIDGSSFMCFDEDTGVDYSKIAMDAGPKKPVTRQTCKTTFAQCRAKNPLFCRFHGPKLLEKDIKSAIAAALGKGCVVSVTKDKGQKNPMTFRLTVGCPPAKKNDVEKIVHMFMTQNPGISSPEEYKDLGDGKKTTEFDMDILKADEPPKKNDLKGQAAQWETEKAKAKGKTMPVVGETPPKVEKLANEGGVPQTEVQQPPVEEEVAEKVEEKVESSIETQPALKDESLSKIKEALKGTSLEDSNLSAEDWMNNDTGKLLGHKIDIGKNQSRSLSAFVSLDKPEEVTFQILQDDGDKWETTDVNEAIALYEDPQAYHASLPDDEEIDKKSYEDEFNAALMEYQEEGGGADNDAKNIEINEAFTKAFIGNDAEGMKSAIEAMKKLVSDVKGVEGEKKGAEIKDVLGVLSGLNHEIPDFNISYDAMGAKNPTDIKISAYGDGDFVAMLNKVDSILADVGYGVSGTNGNDMHIVKKGGSDAGENKGSTFHFVDDAAMKMTGDIDDLAHQNPELISSDDNVSALYYGAQQAINAVDEAKKNLEEIDEKLKEFEDRESNGLSAADVLAKLTLKNSKKAQQEAYDDAKAHAELSVKDFKESMEKAKANVVDSIKATNAEMVENIVKTTAREIFKNGKPDGVDSVVDMIDALHEDMTSLANEKLGEGGDLYTKFLKSKKKNGLHEAYKAVSSASLEFDGAVSSFKDLIDGVKGKEGAESLKRAVNDISEYSQKLKDAFAAYKMAVDKVKKDVLDLAEMNEKKKKLSQNSGNDQPSQDEILDAAKKHAIDMASSDVDSSTKYYAKEIGDVISGEGFPKSVDKFATLHGASRRETAKHYLYMLKKLDGVSPSLIAALQKVVDMPKWGEKKLSQNSSENTMDLSGDFAKFVGLDTEASGKDKSASADFYPNLANAISAALQEDGNFTNFKTNLDYDNHKLYLTIKKKQKEGFDEYEDTPEIPTDEENSNVEYMLQRELGKVGLALDYGSAKQSGEKLMWEIVPKSKGKKAQQKAPRQEAKKAAMNANEKKLNQNNSVNTIKEIAKALPKDFSMATSDNPYVYLDGGSTLSVSEAEQILKDKFYPLGYKISAIKHSPSKKAGYSITKKATTPDSAAAASADPKAAIKAKIAAMSVKEKMEKSIPILEKKIKAEPNNEKWQKMLKIAKAYLASHKD